MPLHPMAGTPAPRSMLTHIPRLVSAYYTVHPDVSRASQRVIFGTSGHRGTSLAGSFNEDHILAVTQAICLYRKEKGIPGPLFMGMDTHALSEPAFGTALEVLAANAVDVVIQRGLGYTPTPVISHAILTHNRAQPSARADGIVVTPSHNPPDAGGFKYNPPRGGPADTHTTQWIARTANSLLADGNREVKRLSAARAFAADTTHDHDYIGPYVNDLGAVIDMEAVRSAGLKIAADALGGAGLAFWEPIKDRYGLDITVMHDRVDPTFGFMTLDRDGAIRMDCSSPYAMAGLITHRNSYDISFGNDPDFDRHGIVTPTGGLMNPNHFLSVAVWYLFRNRKGWRKDAAIGKTLVSSSMIDRVGAYLGRKVSEVPVGFKWFVGGLLDGSYAFGGEESAGAAFARRDGSVWTTDKDGFIMDLLAAEITATTGRDPDELYQDLTERFGNPMYERIDEPATAEQKVLLARLSPSHISTTTLAGEPIVSALTHAPGNGEPIGGIKVVTATGWCAARPSGTEDVYKIYAESFKGSDHLKAIQDEARALVRDALSSASP